MRRSRFLPLLLLALSLACTAPSPAAVGRELPLLPTATPFYLPTPTPTRPPREGTPAPPSLLPPREVQPPEAREPGAPTTADLQVVRANLMRCRNDREDEFWGGWLVHLNSRDFFLASARSEAVGRDAEGRAVVRVPVRDYAVAVGVPADWVVPGEELDRPSRTVLRGPPGQIARFELEFAGSFGWTRRSPTASRLRWTTAVAGHTVGDGPYPAHTLRVTVRNTGRGGLPNASLFAFIYDSAGRPVDMIASDAESIPEGEERTLEATSLAGDDHCRGPRDPNGYSADYWISFWSGNQLHSVLESVPLPPG